LCFTNCQQESLNVPEEVKYTDLFEEIWQYTGEHYCCFDMKGVPWHAVYTYSSPSISDDMSEEQFKSVIYEMLSQLVDKTLSLETSSETLYFDYYLQIYPENLDETVRDNYPSNDAFIEDKILYLADLPDPIQYPSIGSLIDESEGLIIDLRNVDTELRYEEPSGGIINFVDRLKSSEVLGTRRTTSGSGNDYTTTDFELGGEGISDYPFPVVLLCNNGTVGEGNVTAFALSHLDSCTVVGDVTGGGNLDIESFTLSNGWVLNIPKTTILNSDGNSIGNGLGPDILIDDDPATWRGLRRCLKN